jgi:hypothetical protein
MLSIGGCSANTDRAVLTSADPAGQASDAGAGDAGDNSAGNQDGVTPPAPVDRSDAGPCTEVVDVVLALDVSSSMGFVLDQLESDIARVVSAANALAPDAHFGLVSFVDNHAFDTTGPLEGGVVHTDASTLQSAFARVRTTYTTPNRNPGDGPSGPTTQNPICEENALDALYAAANEFPWRDNATRVVIVATDDSFLEAPDNYGDRDGDGRTNLTDFPREGDYPALRNLADTVSALKKARVRVFSFTRAGYEKDALTELLEGPCGCGTGCRLGDSTHVGDGWSVPYAGQTPLPEATDGRNFDLGQVQSGALSLADTINDVVVDSYCSPPPI